MIDNPKLQDYNLINNNGFSYLYFIFLFILIISTILTILFLRNQSNKQIKKVVFICFITFLILEITKQIVYSYNKPYPWWIFPYQFCSTPLYITLFVLLYKEKTNTLSYFLSCYSIYGGIAVMVNPSSVMVPNIIISIQTMIWHNLMIWLSIYLLVNKCLKTNILCYIKATLCFIALVVIALLLNTLFNNLASSNIISSAPNLFYLNFGQVVFIPIIKYFTDKIGTTPFIFIYIGAFMLGAFIIWIINRLILNKKGSNI